MVVEISTKWFREMCFATRFIVWKNNRRAKLVCERITRTERGIGWEIVGWKWTAGMCNRIGLGIEKTILTWRMGWFNNYALDKTTVVFVLSVGSSVIVIFIAPWTIATLYPPIFIVVVPVCAQLASRLFSSCDVKIGILIATKTPLMFPFFHRLLRHFVTPLGIVSLGISENDDCRVCFFPGLPHHLLNIFFYLILLSTSWILCYHISDSHAYALRILRASPHAA